jgi:two-component system chemotaxis response regulator CheB
MQVPVETRSETHAPKGLEIELKIAKEHNAMDEGVKKLGEPSSFSCPECHGVLLQIAEGSRVRFRCHTGHAYSAGSLLAAIGEGIEDALWTAVRALEEGGLLMRQMASHVKANHNAGDAEALLARAEEAKRQSDDIRRLVSDRDPLVSKKS